MPIRNFFVFLSHVRSKKQLKVRYECTSSRRNVVQMHGFPRESRASEKGVSLEVEAETRAFEIVS